VIKEFTVLKIINKKEDTSGQETLFVEMCEIVSQNTLSSLEKVIFILNPKSSLGIYIISEPDKPKTLNLSDFVINRINLPEGVRKAFVHNDYLRMQSENKSPNKNPNYSYIQSNLKKILADHYFKNFLTDNAIFKKYNSNTVDFYRNNINNSTANDKSALNYFNLAAILSYSNDISSAKKYFLRSAVRGNFLNSGTYFFSGRAHSNIKADAFFALGCLKTKVGENGDLDFQNAIKYYELDSNEYTEYVNEILNCSSTFRVWGKIKLSAEKINGQTTIKFGGGNYSPIQIDLSFGEVNNFIDRVLRQVILPKHLNGYFEIEVSFIEGIPINYISLCNISGFDFIEINEIINKFSKMI
jgi:hypothetical protein